ncbi:hypothetical protein CDD81_953 [Ophiocordyceps australis]|uniref:Uncharacterized protein n=1 Tax=Ophiocordyceps australis TaxID=1399860 RepID=A0A2C5XX05_9HYPO|nr:hypothetical protein CDD81_953 [Ophiocordyceps australis]
MFTDSPDEEPTKSKSDRKKAMAEKHIKEARSRDSPSLPRQSSHASRHPWPVPSPPPMPSQPPQFAAADDNLHRPAGRQRRGSEGSQWAASWARHKPRDDTPDFPPGLGTPKQNKFAKSASTASPGMAEPGARREGQRHGMGPIDAFPRAMPGSRSPPFSPMAGYGEDQPRGRQRSRMQSQIREEESNDVYAERRARDRDYERFPERDRERDYDVKHHRTRSSRLPDDGRGERYPDGSGRIKFETFTTSRRGEPLAETKTYYSRPPMTGRGSSFNPANVRHSKLYSQSDVLYGDYPATGIYA